MHISFTCTGRPHCDVLLNNMCEVFNRQLIDGRDKPIITALEYIREYLMKRIVNVGRVIAKSEGLLTPTTTRILESTKTQAAQYVVLWNGGDKYQVSGPWQDQCVVDSRRKSCTCRKWELTGIPCRHVVATIWYMAVNGEDAGLPEEWVHDSYKLATWKKVYEFKVGPLSGKEFWPKSDCALKLTPPIHHTQVGRPKKKRRKSAEELSQPVKGSKLSKAGKTVTCTKCKKNGHNSRTCKGQEARAV